MSAEVELGHTPPLVRIWDNNFNLIGTVDEGWRIDQPGIVTVPTSNWLGRWLLSDERRSAVFITADADGLRHVGGLEEIELRQEEFGEGKVKYIKATFADDRLPKLRDWASKVEGL